MGPRIIDSHDPPLIGSDSDCHIISSSTSAEAAASGIHQRRNLFSVRASSPSFVSSSDPLVVSSAGDTHASHPILHKPLMVSESHSLGGAAPDMGGAGLSHVTFAVTYKPPPPPPQSILFSGWRPRLIMAWSIHFASCILILWYGTFANHGDRCVLLFSSCGCQVK